MPPKRKALAETDGNTAGASSKKSKKAKKAKNGADDPEAPIPPMPALFPVASRARWSKVSGSANLDAEFMELLRDKERAFAWLTTCPPSCADDEDHKEEDEGQSERHVDMGDSDNKPEGKKPKPKCGTPTCMCNKSPEDHPAHPWVLTRAGLHLYAAQHTMADLRDPDNFHMYTFNDHAPYGVIEVILNLVSLFHLSVMFLGKDAWQERWAVLEATALFMLSDQGMRMQMADDCSQVQDTADLVGFMALHMFDILEKAGLLREDSEVRNLGYIMALYIKLAAIYQEIGLEREPVSGSGSAFESDPAAIGSYIYAYAKRHNITLRGVSGIGDLVADLDENVAMPEQTEDTWGWRAKIRVHYSAYGQIGGDDLDITAWTSAERKAHSFDGKDPLGKKERDALKQGVAIRLG